METALTKSLKLGIWNSTHKQGVFGCFEVTIGWFGNERVDYMTYGTNGVWRCYEIKISKSDFHSKNHNTFIGNFNYYIMPPKLYEQIKSEIPDGIGVYVPEDNKYLKYPQLKNVCHASHRGLVRDEQILKNSMIRSLCREVDKQMQSENEVLINEIKRDCQRYKSQYENLEHRYFQQQDKLLRIQHPEYFEEEALKEATP